MGSPIKLEWSEGTADWLLDREDLPCSLAGAIAVATKLAHASQPDGTECVASARWLEKTTKINATRIRELLRLLATEGWLHDSGVRRGRGGSRVYSLTIPRAFADHASAVPEMRTADTTADHTSAVHPRTADTTADDTSPTTDYRERLPRAAANGHSDVTEQEFTDRVWEIVRAKGGGAGLARKIAREDRPLILAELRDRKRNRALAQAISECGSCDEAGFIDLDDNTRVRHDHEKVPA